MRRATYVFGTTILFALLGVWVGRVMGSPEGWAALLGAGIGWLLGTACAPAPAK